MHTIMTEGRAVLGADVHERVQRYMDDYGTGLSISKVNVEMAQAPRQVQPAFDDVIKAREDEQRVKNEAESYANGIIPEARGHAQRQLEEANAYREEVVARAEGESKRFTKLLFEYEKAPGVTRERLYLDAMESVLGQTTKVLLDVEGGNNIMYLPLDKLVERSAADQRSQQRLDDVGVQEVTNQVIDRLRRRQEVKREGR
jgi:membrane protease subunit HflK